MVFQEALHPKLPWPAAPIANNAAIGSSPSGSYEGGLWNRYGIAALSGCTVNDNLVLERAPFGEGAYPILATKVL
jgi:hypothetical protein